VERFYVPSSSGEMLVHESIELVARDSDGSFFFAYVHGLRRSVLDGRTGASYVIDYANKTVTLHRSYSPAPLQPPTGEEYKHVPPERSLGTGKPGNRGRETGDIHDRYKSRGNGDSPSPGGMGSPGAVMVRISSGPRSLGATNATAA
jgi:hypothetical protein